MGGLHRNIVMGVWIRVLFMVIVLECGGGYCHIVNKCGYSRMEYRSHDCKCTSICKVKNSVAE